MTKYGSRIRRKDPSEKQKPFFDKQAAGPSFFGGDAIQRKVIMGNVNDAAEKEADAAAQQITQVQKAEKKEEEKPVQKAEKKEEEKPVQKAENKEEEKPVQKAEKKEDEKPVQAKQDPRVQRQPMPLAKEKGDSQNPSFEERLIKRKGMGFQLPDDVRRNMESKFHFSFREVRIHTDKEAADMCEAIHSLAFAHGYDIYFNQGKYNPNSEAGKELLAHELAHIVQQNG